MIDDKTTRAPCGWIFKIRVGRAIDDAEGMTSIGCLPAALLVRELVISSQTLHSVEGWSSDLRAKIDEDHFDCGVLENRIFTAGDGEGSCVCQS